MCLVKKRNKRGSKKNHEGGILPEGRILAGYYGLNINISITFQAVKNLSTHPTHLCSGLFCNFFGDFWVNLEIESFSQRISKIYENRKF